MRSSDPPSDSTSASTRESAFLPFSATSESNCSGSSFRLPVRSANRIRRTGHRIRTANGTVSRSSPPKKRTSPRRSARPSRSTHRAYTGPTEVGHDEPHGTPDSRLAEASRTVLPALRMLAANGKRRTRSIRVSMPATEAAAPTHGASLNAPTTFAQRRTQSSEIQHGSSAVSSPRQRDRHFAAHHRSDTPHDPACPVASSVTAVQAHPSRSTHHPKTAHRTSRPAKPFEHTRCPKPPHVSAAEAAGTWQPPLDSLSQTRRLAATSVT